jgi:hypothetical protein
MGVEEIVPECRETQGGRAGGEGQSGASKPGLTRAWSRLPTAYASLRLPATAHAQRSAV